MFSKKISYGNYENLSDVEKNDEFYHITNPKLSNIVIDNSWVSWINIPTTTPITCDTHIKPEVEYKELKPSICSCCGAPLRSNKCEYCDVEYR